MPPKVFVSHASEDKDRFVIEFAKRLRARGVDAWLDKWEMLPGDSLVDKIFEEGLKGASAVIVVVSKFSIAKPWVREELNAGVVQRINKGAKLIPVVIDECEVPAALASTLYARIKDTEAYDPEFERVVAAIFGLSDKPPIGEAPVYASAASATIGGLSRIDSMTLALACEAAIAAGDMFVHTSTVLDKAQSYGAPLAEFEDSLQVLGDKGYLRLNKNLAGGAPGEFWVTDYGFEAFARSGIPGYEDKTRRVVAALVNDDLDDNMAIAARIGETRLFVDHALNLLESQGLLKKSRYVGGNATVVSKSPLLRRMLADGQA